MTDKKIEKGDLEKALETLQSLAKSQGSTATTKVESMVGESGSTQLFHTASNSDPGSWAGSSWKGETWEDMIEANGTDLGTMKKLAKSIMDKLAKGGQLNASEVEFVSKGGLNFLKKDEDDDKKKEEVSKAQSHPDEKEDKKLVKEMVKPDAMKSEVNKSLMDFAAEQPSVQEGFEMSDFLSGFAQVMHKSLQAMESRVTDRVLTALAANAEEQGEVQKSLATAVASLGEVLTVHAQRIEQMETAPARGPKTEVSVQKSMGHGGDGLESLSKSQINDRLLELVEKSQASPADVLKFDATGTLSPELTRKVLGR